MLLSKQDLHSPSHALTAMDEKTNDSNDKSSRYKSFVTSALTTDQEYKEKLNKLKVKEHVIEKLLRVCTWEDQNVDDTTPNLSGLGRPFELYFKYEHSGSDEVTSSELGTYISVDAIYNYQLQCINHQLQLNNYNDNLNNNDDNMKRIYKDDRLNNSYANLALYLQVKNDESIRNTMTTRPRCIYFVINGCWKMQNIWDSSIVEAVSQAISELNENDVFGICVFNELKMRHFISFDDKYPDINDEKSKDQKNDSNNDKDNDSGISIGKSNKFAQSQGRSTWQDVDDDDYDSDAYIKIRAKPHMYRFKHWGKHKVKDEVRDWLESHSPGQIREIKKAFKDNGVKFNALGKPDISILLLELLCYLETPLNNSKKYFKQVVLIDYGEETPILKLRQTSNITASDVKTSLNQLETTMEEDKLPGYQAPVAAPPPHYDEVEQKEKLGSKDNDKKQKDEIYEAEAMLKDVDKLVAKFSLVETGNENGDSSVNDIDFVGEAPYCNPNDVCFEQDLMNKINYFYSKDAKQNLGIEPFNTRVYTVGLGRGTHLEFLECLSRTTRGVAKVELTLSISD